MTPGVGRPVPWRAVALCGLGLVAVADVALPLAMTNRRPGLVDLMTGLVLMWCGAELADCHATRASGGLLATAGVAWFLPDLAVTGSAALDRALGGLSLAHVPLVVGALLLTPAERLTTWASGAVGISTLAALTAIIGGHAVALPLTGALLVAALLDAHRHAAVRRRRPWNGLLLAGGGYGGLLVLAPLLRSFREVDAWLPTAYATSLTVVGVVLGAIGQDLRPHTAVDVGPGLAQVDHLLDEALGLRGTRVVVESESGWVDRLGEVADPLAVVEVGPGAGVATTPAEGGRRARPGATEARLRKPLLRDCVVLAAGNLRLRADSAARVAELARLRSRLVGVEAEERRQLLERLRAGPLAQLGRLSADLRSGGVPPEMSAGVELTRVALEEIALGLDPLTPTGSSIEAMQLLVSRSAVSATLRSDGSELPEALGRTIWFVCAEALANAAKHAPGASVLVDLRTISGETVLQVTDDGPGGADPDGHGLRGVRDRVSAAGGSLEVVSGPAGTCLRARFPVAAHSGQHVVMTSESTDAPGSSAFVASGGHRPTEEP